jgi:hypothetical protein
MYPATVAGNALKRRANVKRNPSFALCNNQSFTRRFRPAFVVVVVLL